MSWVNGPAGTADPDFGVRWACTTSGGLAGNWIWGLDSADTVLTGNSVNLTTYLDAVEAYNVHDPDTTAFVTAGPVDGYHATEAGYQRYMKYQTIRQHVADNGVACCLTTRTSSRGMAVFST